MINLLSRLGFEPLTFEPMSGLPSKIQVLSRLDIA